MPQDRNGVKDRPDRVEMQVTEVAAHAEALNQSLLRAEQDKQAVAAKLAEARVEAERMAVRWRRQRVNLAGLQQELEQARSTIEVLQAKSLDEREIREGLVKVAQAVEVARESSQQLTAEVEFPRPEAMRVRLVPAHQLERLEEYRGQVAMFSAVAGLFGGATLGILCNWATDEKFTMTRISIVLAGLFFLVGVLSLVWTNALRMRAGRVSSEMKAQE